jgi:hypothetical protein
VAGHQVFRRVLVVADAQMPEGVDDFLMVENPVAGDEFVDEFGIGR